MNHIIISVVRGETFIYFGEWKIMTGLMERARNQSRRRKGMLAQSTPDLHLGSDVRRQIAEEPIDNNYDRVGAATRNRNRDGSPGQAAINQSTGEPRGGVGIHLTPTKRKRKLQDGTVTNHALQMVCRECKKRKTRYQCSVCFDRDGKECWLCSSETGRACFATHIDNCHSCD